ncbi:hypothetical protein D9V41_09315 [Aeromicrobium phragmitis]|uniref:Uncharacterized protein n=1 Tax=Aeromicrobium phragmitis TaxID=2478914 RepID=A0A3L8PM93_9ACTN|nr:hypothetical protein D9V41_09315 [Aeromicrobium phragmitis]
MLVMLQGDLTCAGLFQDCAKMTSECRGYTRAGTIANLRPRLCETTFGQRPHDLHQEGVSRTNPSMKGDAIDPQLLGDRADVDLLPGEVAATSQTNGVCPSRSPRVPLDL